MKAFLILILFSSCSQIEIDKTNVDDLNCIEDQKYSPPLCFLVNARHLINVPCDNVKNIKKVVINCKDCYKGLK